MADDTGAGTPSAAGSSPASPVEGAPSTESASASATATPVITGAHPTQDITGEPPKERWADILANARSKAEGETRTKLEQEYRQKYGWADDFQNDPLSFLDQRLATHPQYGAQLTAWAARHLGARRGTQPAIAEKPKPDVPVVDAQGNVTGYVYSDKQQDVLDEWRWEQRQAKFDERFGPLEKLSQRIEQAEQTAHVQEEATQHSAQTLSELRGDPYFKH